MFWRRCFLDKILKISHATELAIILASALQETWKYQKCLRIELFLHCFGNKMDSMILIIHIITFNRDMQKILDKISDATQNHHRLIFILQGFLLPGILCTNSAMVLVLSRFPLSCSLIFASRFYIKSKKCYTTFFILFAHIRMLSRCSTKKFYFDIFYFILFYKP